MSGGKGGSQTSKVEIPAWLEDPSKRAIQRGEDIAAIGYTPYMGPDVAAFTPMQQSAFQGTSDAAGAFGMPSVDGMAGVPQAQQFSGGVQGYSSYPIFQQTMDQFRTERPGQAGAIDAMFIDPITGRPRGPVTGGPVQPVNAGTAARPYAEQSHGMPSGDSFGYGGAPSGAGGFGPSGVGGGGSGGSGGAK
jgi:hypothetical protein